MNDIPNKEKFRPDEAASILDVSVKTIYCWIATGQMEAIRTGKKLLKIPRAEIIKKQQPAIQ
jgi:excisionase family DNA binding protein